MPSIVTVKQLHLSQMWAASVTTKGTSAMAAPFLESVGCMSSKSESFDWIHLFHALPSRLISCFQASRNWHLTSSCLWNQDLGCCLVKPFEAHAFTWFPGSNHPSRDTKLSQIQKKSDAQCSTRNRPELVVGGPLQAALGWLKSKLPLPLATLFLQPDPDPVRILHQEPRHLICRWTMCHCHDRPVIVGSVVSCDQKSIVYLFWSSSLDYSEKVAKKYLKPPSTSELPQKIHESHVFPMCFVSFCSDHVNFSWPGRRSTCGPLSCPNRAIITLSLLCWSQRLTEKANPWR